MFRHISYIYMGTGMHSPPPIEMYGTRTNAVLKQSLQIFFVQGMTLFSNFHRVLALVL